MGEQVEEEAQQLALSRVPEQTRLLGVVQPAPAQDLIQVPVQMQRMVQPPGGVHPGPAGFLQEAVQVQVQGQVMALPSGLWFQCHL